MPVRRLLLLTALVVSSACHADEPAPPAQTTDASQVDAGAVDSGRIDGADAKAPDGPPMEITVCPGEAYTTCWEAIPAVAPGGTVRLCPGTYQGCPAIDKPMTLVGIEGAEHTIIQHGIEVWTEGLATIDGVTFNHGHVRCDESRLRMVRSVISGGVNGNQAPNHGDGAGFLSHNCDLDIEDVTFSDNHAWWRGGGAMLVDSRGTVRGSRFLDNEAEHGAGVAVKGGTMHFIDNQFRRNQSHAFGGGADVDGGGVFETNVFEDNRAGGTGGALYARNGVLSSRGNVFANNRLDSFTGSGGGIGLSHLVVDSSNDTVVGNVSPYDGGGASLSRVSGVFRNLSVRDNISQRFGGGMSLGYSHVTFLDVEIVRNSAVTSGGGLMLVHDESQFRGGRLGSNYAGRGGGAFIRDVHAAMQPFSAMRIERNHASDGGGIVFENNFAAISLWGVYLDDNVATRGGGVYTRSTELLLRNARFTGNRAAHGGAIWVAANPAWDEEDECWGDPCPAPPAGEVEIEHATMHGNVAADGAAVWVDGPYFTVRGAIVAGNTGGPQVAVHQAAPVAGQPQPYPTMVWTFNDTFPATFTGMSAVTDTDGNISLPPQFLDAAVGDFHLAPGSPCIDAGPPWLADHDGSPADMGMWGGQSSGLP